tara:strand:+ start:24 stop:389 length:366 start_codon:yes stop_codon:yes gene_type:complete
MKKIKSNPPKTALTISIGFIIVYLFIEENWSLYLSVFIGITGLFFGGLSKVIEKIWFKIAKVLGLFIPNIILTLIFFIFLFPISLLQKLFVSNNLNFKNRPKSNYITTNKMFSSKDLKNPW